jgi:hypothetical protein
VSAATETDLVSHLVEEHGAVWTSTNSFGLDDLVIPTPRESFDDRQAEQPSWVRRLISRSGH